VTGLSWLDVDTPEALREAERRLMQDPGRKTRDGPVSRHLNRPISHLLSCYLVCTSITPNQIPMVSWLVSCVAAEALRLAHGSVFAPLFNRWIAIYRAISMGGG